MKVPNYLRKQGVVYVISIIMCTKGKDLNEIPGQPPDREVGFIINRYQEQRQFLENHID